ncbi:MAG: RNA-binding transcriptional accessory protein [Desulfobacterales bacterium]|nr:RNA-binding transcriptional accessory protein [Desulfobacterales bacterium]
MNLDPNYLIVSNELNLGLQQVTAVALLLDQGATIPFIARYRKELTGSLDEVAITAIRDRLKQLKDMDERRQAILKSLEQHGHLTDELNMKILQAQTLAELEDIYLPFRPKRKTRASIAKEKGLEPLALEIFEQTSASPHELAAAFVCPEKGVDTIEDALAGARDILAEMMNENQDARKCLRQLFIDKAVIKTTVSKGMEAEGIKYKDYYNWEELANTAPSHRILAMRRGEKEDILNLSILPSEEDAIALLKIQFIKHTNECAQQVNMALNDAYKRLLSRSLETEMRVMIKDRADKEAIAIFQDNLRQLLLSPPLGSKNVMGIDPGFRTGCKVVCLNREGKLISHCTIFPHASDNQRIDAAKTILQLCAQYQIEAIAIGNGTAGRETEAFVKKVITTKPEYAQLPIIIVNESGASIYSASETARKEFPDLDLTVRGSVSIGRRLMDPLSELVKIDPKSIGVGQYQHDVDQTALKESLDDIVVSCVNQVGVELNRASVELLTYVSGLGPQLAQNIISYRNENGAFGSRDQLKKVTRLGKKAFEQCAGFLRISNSDNPLDSSAVHPESYDIVYTMANDLHCSVIDLMKKSNLREQINIHQYVNEKVGLPTLQDILSELAKPGRDPRKEFETVTFSEHVLTIQDLKPGMTLPGIVTNITAFGAFVDIGVHQDGLVHISELSDGFVSDASAVVKVQQKVTVKVLEVDLDRNRISLSMRKEMSKREPTNRQAAASAIPKTSPKTAQKNTGSPTGSSSKAPFHNPFGKLMSK